MRLRIGLSSVLTQWPICQFIVYRTPAREGRSGSPVPAPQPLKKKKKKKSSPRQVHMYCGFSCCQEQKDPFSKCSAPIWLANAQKVADGWGGALRSLFCVAIFPPNLKL